MQLAIWCVIFLAALVALLLGADLFTKNSEKLGRVLGISQFIIGITVVSIGTSIPELFTAIMAIYKNEAQFVAADVIGSNIANIFIFIGVTTLILKKIDFQKENIGHSMLVLGSLTAMLVMMLLDKQIVMYEAILLLVAYGGYGAYQFITRATWKDKLEDLATKEKLNFKIPLFIILGIVGVFIGANYTIESVIKIAEITKINSTFLVFTAVALGTSLPELVVSIMTAIRGNFSMSLGNIFGSNFFNTTLIFGISGLISDLPISDVTFAVGIPFLIVATYIFVTSAAHKKLFSLDEGVICLVLYVMFVTQLFFASH